MMALALAACGADKPPAPAPAAAVGVLSADWIYTPATEETADATGSVTVEPSVSGEGPMRTLRTGRGDALQAILVGEADPAWRADLARVTQRLAGRPGARATLYAVYAGNLCLGAQATHVVWYEPDLIEGRTLALALLSGPPDESGSTVCRVLRYTRERSGAGSEDSR